MLTIAGHTFSSRLLMGTGKFATPALMLASLEASGAGMVTLAMKRVTADIASAADPVQMALAFRHAVEAGELARASCPGAVTTWQAQASSPLTAFLDTLN